MHEKISISEAAARIARHVTFTHRASTPHKLISQRIRDAVKAGELTSTKHQGAQAVYWDDTKEWAAKKWPSFARENGIPQLSEVAMTSSVVASDFFDFVVIPGDLRRCQEHLMDAHDEISRLRSQVSRLKDEIDGLRPLAESRQRSNSGLEKGRQALKQSRSN